MLGKIRRYYFTICHLQPRQIYYQIFYRIKKVLPFRVARDAKIAPSSFVLTLQPSIPSRNAWLNGSFRFLNLERKFHDTIDWDFSSYGKLWTYNLNYFEFLNQAEIVTSDALHILDDFCSDPRNRKTSSEPYPTSLRGINWIKFFSYNGVRDSKYDRILFADYQHLKSNLEYHLMGNHLLENGFSLLFGAYYFRNESFYDSAWKILKPQLEEQVLDDGGHFELSPMYHQIILFRTLDAINLIRNNPWKNDPHLSFLMMKAKSMTGWLRAMTFNNGDVPMVNDSAFGISPNSTELFHYAEKLDIHSEATSLSDSGYRIIRTEEFELFVDVGNIGPDYIPGHAHSDTLSFVLHVSGRPIIVDTGVSRYDAGDTRLLERSTKSHNTVLIDDKEQSDIWSSFRVGKRAKIIERTESKNCITAAHDGYKENGAIHRRMWKWDTRSITIVDEIHAISWKGSSVALIHFHPDVSVKIQQNKILAGPLGIEVSDYAQLDLSHYQYALGFNHTATGQVVRIAFKPPLTTKLHIISV